MALSRRTVSVSTVVVVLGALTAGVWWRLRPDAAPAEGGDESAEVDAAPVQVPSASTFSADQPDPVEGATVLRDTLWTYLHAPAHAAAMSRTIVAAQVAGTVTDVRVRENALVAEGEILARIDDEELLLEVARLESDVVGAQVEYERLTMFDEELDDRELRSQRSEVARSQSGLAAAEVALKDGRVQLERATVRAPFAGRVADVELVPGQYVAPGTPLLTVLALDPIRVEADVLESGVPDLREGREATVRFAAFPGRELTGRIESINPVVTPERRATRVTVLLPNRDGRIKPGMYAEVALQAQAFPDRVMVPRTAILERGDGRRRTMLFVYEPERDGWGFAKWRYVTPGRENERFVEIVPTEETDMVAAGEIVLVDGHHYMGHDTRVRLVESVFAAGGRPGN